MEIKDGYIRMLLPAVEAEIFLTLREKGELSPQAIAEELKKSTYQMNVSLSRLVNKGVVKRSGKEESITKPRYTYTIDENGLENFINAFTLSDEKLEDAINKINNYKKKVQTGLKLQKPKKLESQEAAENFYYKALESIKDRNAATEYLNKSTQYAKMSRQTFEEVEDIASAQNMHLFEAQNNFFLSRLTGNEELLSKAKEISMKIIQNAVNSSIEQKANDILTKSALESQVSRNTTTIGISPRTPASRDATYQIAQSYQSLFDNVSKTFEHITTSASRDATYQIAQSYQSLFDNVSKTFEHITTSAKTDLNIGRPEFTMLSAPSNAVSNAATPRAWGIS